MAFPSYAALKDLLRGRELPAALVDLDALDGNIARIRAIAEGHGKGLRIASKSVRVPALAGYIRDRLGPVCAGLMCYAARELQLLAEHGHDQLLLAYPTVQPADLRCLQAVAASGRQVAVMLDSAAHVAALDGFWAGTGLAPLAVCIDVDMSYRPLGGALHLGVRRSPVHGAAAFEALLETLSRAPALRLAGVMGYEAQIAGLGERNPFTPLLNPLKAGLKALSAGDVARRRGALAAVLARRGIALDFFNGGGTGSLAGTAREPWITELAAGSGFLQSHLFDYYPGSVGEPALCFALQVSRVPGPGLATCLGGGYTASGEAGPDKAPRPFLPEGLALLAAEGCGEVQTPFRLPPGCELAPGDPVFLRPAKAGELAERFSHYLLLRGGAIVDQVPTYRGLGAAFF